MSTVVVPVSNHASDVSLPALVANGGAKAARRFLEFFTVNIRNPHTRAAYARAAGSFIRWCEARGISDLAQIEPVHVAAYVEELGRTVSKPTVKQHLATLRMLFDWLVVGQVVAVNPAASVRGPKYSVSKGLTPVVSAEEARELFSSMDTRSVVGLRDRAIIGVLTYTFARVSAMILLSVEDYYPQGKKWWLRLHEKNGKVNEMPCHPTLIEYLDTYSMWRESAKSQDPGQLHANLLDYVTKFSSNVRDIFLDKFLFTDQLKRLKDGGILWQVFDRFAQVGFGN